MIDGPMIVCGVVTAFRRTVYTSFVVRFFSAIVVFYFFIVKNEYLTSNHATYTAKNARRSRRRTNPENDTRRA